MAFKSPGIYFTEIDNTEYQNPAAEINTTVAIVGFAKKGPINEPTEITSWSQFKNTFGSPITGDFAPLAVRNVLSYGGTVLFVRIADESLASQSAVVLKSAAEAVDGKIILNRTSVPSTELQTNGFYYAKLYNDDLDENGRIIWLRSPESGYLSGLSILQQLQDCLNEFYGFSEYKFKTTKKASGDNYRFFNIGTQNAKISSNEATEVTGPFMVNLTSEKAKNGSLLADSINNAIGNGTVAYQEFELQGFKYKGGEVTNFNYTGGEDDQSLDNYGILIPASENIPTSSTAAFNLTTDDNIYTITTTLAINSGKILLSDVVAAINKQINNYGVNCELEYKSSDSESLSVYLLFYSTTNSTILAVNPYSKDSKYSNSLFITDGTDNVAGNEQSNPIIFLTSNGEAVGKTAIKTNPVVASYNQDSNTIMLSLNAATTTKGSYAKFEEPVIGKYISQVNDNEGYKNHSYTSNANNYAIGERLRTVNGEASSDFLVKINSSKKIELYRKGKTNAGTIKFETISEIPSTKATNRSLLELFNNRVTEYSDSTYDLEYILRKTGSAAENANNNARLGFIAKEMGEGTTDIGIEIYTSISPLDEVTKIHYVDLYVGGIKKESWEDVSYDPSASNFIGTLINEDPMNGGSAYVSVVYDRGEQDTLNIKDTASYAESGIVYLGQDLYNGGTAATSSTNLADVRSYDYAIGDNGVVSDSTALYLNVLDTTTSGLSNKDLYSWHILITPDNISAEVQDQAITLCEEMDDGIYIADPPEGLTRKAVVNWHNGRLGASDRVSALNSNFCCTYWPWVKIYDATSSKYVWAPPSVVMAPQFCKVDNSYAPWYAPAGETNGLVSTVIDIEETPNKTDRDALYLDQNRVNPFLKLRNGNILAYGEKTCQRKNSTLTKIHTRRMLIALKKELRNAIKGYIFMPTMTENITQIRSRVTSIMETYKQGGGVDSYVVVCDDTNNTTETLQQDILNVAVTCVPTGCIEQVEISLTLNKSADSSE